MNVALRRPMTIEQFLAWEECQEFRFEFDGVGPVAMNGGTINHESVGGNVRFALQRRLAGSECRAFGPTLKIEVAGRIRYPDAFVACGKLPGKMTVVREPVVVFEVLSPDTSDTDRTEKLCEYQGTPSILRYVILEQDAIMATVYSRNGAGWAEHPLQRAGDLAMPELGLVIPLDEFYVGVDLAPDPAADPAPAA